MIQSRWAWLQTISQLKEELKMAKLEIRDLNHEVEIKKHELEKITVVARAVTLPEKRLGIMC